MITSNLVTATSLTVPVKVFTASTTGEPIGVGVTAQTSAITTMILCNKEAPNLTDETINDVDVSIYLVKSGDTPSATSNIVVSSLTIPAGETVFFSDERIILDGGDEIWVGTSDASRLVVTISTLPV